MDALQGAYSSDSADETSGVKPPRYTKKMSNSESNSDYQDMIKAGRSEDDRIPGRTSKERSITPDEEIHTASSRDGKDYGKNSDSMPMKRDKRDYNNENRRRSSDRDKGNDRRKGRHFRRRSRSDSASPHGKGKSQSPETHRTRSKSNSPENDVSPTHHRIKSRSSTPDESSSNRKKSPVLKRTEESRSPDQHRDRTDKRSPNRKRSPDRKRSPYKRGNDERKRSPDRRRSPGRRRSPDRRRSPYNRKHQDKRRSPNGRKSPNRHRSPRRSIDKRSPDRRRSPYRRSSPDRRKKHRSRSRSHERDRTHHRRFSPKRRKSERSYSRSRSKSPRGRYDSGKGICRAVLPPPGKGKNSGRQLTSDEVEAKLSAHMAKVKSKAVEDAKNVNLPGYLNPAMINVQQFKNQQEKRKLLWSSKKKEEDKSGLSSATWGQQTFSDQATDAKFRQLMGIKNVTGAEANDKIEKSRKALEDLEKEYEKSRVFQLSRGAGGVTGIGLGFGHAEQPN